MQIHVVVMAILCVLCYWKRYIANWFYYTDILVNIVANSYAHTAGFNYDSYDILYIMIIQFMSLYCGDVKTVFLHTLSGFYMLLFVNSMLYLRPSNFSYIFFCIVILILFFIVTFLVSMLLTHLRLLYAKLQ